MFAFEHMQIAFLQVVHTRIVSYVTILTPKFISRIVTGLDGIGAYLGCNHQR
jgi:hypothetical protein